MGLVEKIRSDVLDLILKLAITGDTKMKYTIYTIYTICLGCILTVLTIGCASNANQKISAPLLGSVKNEYIIYNIHVDNLDNYDKATNMVRRVTFAAISTNLQNQTGKTVMTSLGRGNELFAIDNQVLVGHDIGNAASNAVNASASIPLSL